jgi:hypothetical protein
LEIQVDGVSYATPHIFQWFPGNPHTIAAVSPQSGATGTRFIWQTWSDGQTQSHVVAPTTDAEYTATFVKQHLLNSNVSPLGGGTISASPTSATGYYDDGTRVQLTAVPDTIQTFTSWSGDLSGSTNPQSVTMSAPRSVTANFASAAIPVTVQTNPVGLSFSVDGTTYTTAQQFNWTPGSPHTIATTTPQAGGTGTQFAWTGWSDSGALSHSVSPASATTYTANFNTQYLLSLSVNPVGSGTILANPASASGYYDSGAAVQLTGAPNVGGAFLNFGGDLSGSTNPQTITMSAPRSVSATFQPPAGGATGFVTGFALNAPAQRNNFTGWIGMKFTVGANPLSVSTLGRVCLPGNTGAHTVKVVNASTGADVPNGSVVINMAGCTTGQIKYEPLANALALNQGSTYYLASQETSGGDKWYDVGQTTSTTAGVINSAVYSSNGSSWSPGGAANNTYGPTSFQYALAAPDPTPGFLTSVNANAAKRNDFGSWAGFRFTVGATPLVVQSVGRWCVAGNSGTHTVKFVTALGVDVANGSASVSMSGCTANQFVYAPLSSALTLAANTTYFLASLEALGGDQFLESSEVASTTAGIVASSAYYDGVKWVSINNGATSYVAPNFKYSLPSATTINVTVQTYPAGREFTVDGVTYTAAQNLTWTQGSTHTIGTTSPQSGAAGTRYVFTGWSDGGSISHSVNPSANITYTANFGTQYLLTTAVTPAGSGTITPNPAGSYFDSGASVSLSASAGGGYSFQEWTGDLTGTTNPQSIVMSAPRSVTANFLAVSAGGDTPFVTGLPAAGTALRNNFAGWIGMRFTVGATPLNVSAMGRVCVAGNAASHTVKLVLASNGTDVAGGSAIVNMAGCTPGQFAYQNLPNPITLPAGTSYYLASQETSGGDRWYEFAPITATAAGVINNSVYLSGAIWSPVAGVNNSYGPPNFKYSLPSAGTIDVTVQTSPAGRSFTVDGTSYSASQVFHWIPGSSHTIGVSSPQSGAAGTQYAWNSWSDGGAVSHTISPASNATVTADFKTQYLLTTAVAPGGTGTVIANPTSATGYYDTGTPVQLTGTPNVGSTFQSWTGDLSGSTNPQTIVMSSPRSVVANFQGPSGGLTGFVTGFALSGQGLRNNFGGWVGMRFSVGSSALNVSSVGRLCVTGNLEVHAVKFVNASTGIDVPGGSGSVNMLGCTPGQFVYAPLSGTITLSAGSSYYLASREFQGGDRWYDIGSISTTSDGAVSSGVYSTDGSAWNAVSGANAAYVPPTFQYLTAPPDPNPPFVTGISSTTLRNDFSGWVGMKLTVGANPIAVSYLGRICVMGNSGTHTVKLVSVATGIDVAGGTAAVNMSGCVPGQYVYTALPAAINLTGGSAYYLVSQESSGGDRWYDFGGITTRSVATVNNAVYSSGASWLPVGGANTAYVTPNFK